MLKQHIKTIFKLAATGSVRCALVWCVATFFLSAASALAQEKPSEKITYDDHAKPIFLQRCSTCHNADRQDGDLDVTNYTNLMLGGGSGDAIEPGSASDSYLFRLVTHEDSPEMPPSGNKIPDAQIQMLRKWIDGGALENSGSVAKKRKPKKDYSTVSVADKRPETEPVPSRLPLVPQHVAKRPSTVHSIATNPWSDHVAVSSPKQVLLYRVGDLAFRGVIPFPEGQPESIRFSRSGSLLVIGGGKPGASGKVLVWDAVEGRRVAVVGDELDSVLASDINSAQTLVALGGPKKVVRVYDIDGDLNYEIGKHTDWITALQFSPDGMSLVTGDRNGGVHVWESETGNELLTLSGHKDAITAVDWRLDGRLVMTASEDGSVRIWDGGSGKQIKTWNACGQGVTSACFTRDGLVVTGGRDRAVRVWDQNGKKIHEYEKMLDHVSSVAFCNETNRVISGDWLGKIRVHEKANAKSVGSLDGNPPTLETRIAQAQQRLNSATEALKPIERDAADLDSRIEAIEAQNDADSQMRKDAESLLATIAAKRAQVDGLLKSTAQKQQAWQRELAQKKKAAPQVSSSLSSARAALAALGEDADMQQTIDKLSARKDRLDKRIATLAEKLKQANEKKKISKTEIAKFKTKHDETQKRLAMLGDSILKREIQIGKANDQRLKLQQQIAKARQGVANPKQELEHWKQELQFAQDLSRLQTSLTEAEEAEQRKQDDVAAAEEKRKAAEAEVQQAKQKTAELSEAVQSIEQQIRDLKVK